ncbi:hypothetical protein H1C71_028032 [Ictidomys tridecemlineatus]|nr:hypothetical protein H1C71_028032 [Ictidomys tridecemlineatus]
MRRNLQRRLNNKQLMKEKEKGDSSVREVRLAWITSPARSSSVQDCVLEQRADTGSPPKGEGRIDIPRARDAGWVEPQERPYCQPTAVSSQGLSLTLRLR